jgi:peroxiredoxin Q/BCP
MGRHHRGADGNRRHLGMNVDAMPSFDGGSATCSPWPRWSAPAARSSASSLATKGDLITKYNAAYFMASTDPLDSNTGLTEKEHAAFPILSDSTKETAKKYGVLGLIGVANRWTFYIGKDGTILEIDKSIKPKTSAEDIATKLGELGVERVTDTGARA